MSEREASGPPPDQGNSPEIDDLVEEITEHYLDQLHAGQAPDRQALLAAHPHLAVRLNRELDLVETLYTATRRQKGMESGETSFREARAIPASFCPGTSARPEELLSAVPSTGSSRCPRRLGRYLIVGVLGRGGSAMVYRAYDPRFDREVALKVLRKDAPLGTDSGERFERDARIAAQLRHPNIVPLHGTGEQKGRRYIDMELIRGETLEARLARKPLSFHNAAELVRKVAEALHYAHSQGIIHRDIKPSNILLDEQGEPQVTDFGLARREGGEASLTVPGQILGTPHYMPPEQAQGGAHQADGRCDVYSLGVVLYQLLTGRVPFAETTDLITRLYHVVHTAPRAPRMINADIPRDLEVICLKAMEKDPADRFTSAADLAEELQRWLRGDPVKTRPRPWWEQLGRWARRHPWRVASAAVVGATVALAFLQYWRAEDARWREELEARTRAEVEIRILLEQARQRMRIPTQGRRLQAQALLAKIAAPRKLLVAGPRNEQLDLEIRSTFVATLAFPDLQDDPRVSLPSEDFASPWRVALHPDGQWLAIGTHLGPIRWVRGNALQLPPHLDSKKPRPRLVFNPAGTYLAFAAGDGGLSLYDDRLARLGELLPAGTSPVLAVGFSPEGQSLCVCQADGQFSFWRLFDRTPGPKWSIPSGTAEKPTAAPIAPFTAAAFNRKLTTVAVGDALGNVCKIEIGAKRTMWSRQLGPIPVEALAWSPDDELVAVGTKDGSLWLCHTGDGSVLQRLNGFPDGIGNIVFTPDGRWVLAGGRSGAMKVWDSETGELLRSGDGSPWGLSREGRCLARAGSTSVGFSDLVMPTGYRRLHGHKASVEQLAWSRDSRHLASVDGSFEVRVWDVTRALSVDRFQEAGRAYAGNAGVALSDDGATLAYASGGVKSKILLRDVRRGKLLEDYSFVPGFERLVCTGGGRFLLVREEAVEENQKSWRSVAWELRAGVRPHKLGVLRPAEHGERKFFTNGLTSDGHYYWWTGPREPADRYRGEVWDVHTGERVQCVPLATAKHLNHIGAHLSEDGRSFWVGSDGRCWVCSPGSSKSATTTLPAADSVKGGWLAFQLVPGEDHAAYTISVRSGCEAPAWLEFINDDLSNTARRATCFSPDGRYLSWGSQSGVITVADLRELHQHVQEFERALHSK